jgi:hypothetical protein
MTAFAQYSTNLVSALDSSILPMCSSNPNANLYSNAQEGATRLNQKGYGPVYAYDEQVNFNDPRGFVRLLNDFQKEKCSSMQAYNNLRSENDLLRNQVASRDDLLNRARTQIRDLTTQVTALRDTSNCPTCPPPVPCPTCPPELPCDCPTNQDVKTTTSDKKKLPWTWIILGSGVVGYAGYKYYTK